MEGFELTHHAQRQLKERAIQECWVEATLSQPDRQLPVADAFGNTHYLKQIAEFGDRWLRVVVNPAVNPKRIVTVFFDRRVQ